MCGDEMMNREFKILIAISVGSLIMLGLYSALAEPDYGCITFTSDRDGNYEIYIMDAEGKSVRRLTDDPGKDLGSKWSPDGEKIAFASDRDGNYEIYIMDANGTHVRRLTTSPDDDWQPAWSPDGEKIAFTSDRDGDWEIYIMDANGTHVKRLTNTPHYECDAAWSPDGEKIAFTSDRDGDWEIYIMDADGTHVKRLTTNTRSDSDPAWSPDGEKIVFSRSEGDLSNIYIMDADGSHQKNLTDNTSKNLEPAWSPDGEKIVFTSDRWSDQSFVNSDKFQLAPSSCGTGNFAVLGIGKAAPVRMRGPYGIFIMNRDGSNQKRLTSSRFDLVDNWKPAWCHTPCSPPKELSIHVPGYSSIVVILIISTVLFLKRMSAKNHNSSI
jgi:TolB protein